MYVYHSWVYALFIVLCVIHVLYYDWVCSSVLILQCVLCQAAESMYSTLYCTCGMQETD